MAKSIDTTHYVWVLIDTRSGKNLFQTDNIALKFLIGQKGIDKDLNNPKYQKRNIVSKICFRKSGSAGTSPYQVFIAAIGRWESDALAEPKPPSILSIPLLKRDPILCFYSGMFRIDKLNGWVLSICLSLNHKKVTANRT